MKKGSKVGVICCSNEQPLSRKDKINRLINTLSDIGLTAVLSDCIFSANTPFGFSGKERAQALMSLYDDNEIDAIFDISGGDLANEVLPYLDFKKIRNSNKSFWGYSDLTTIINAIYAKAGKQSVLYQVRNLIYDNADRQICDFTDTVMNSKNSLFDFDYEFIQGDRINGVLVGGNIRCLLKLAGTPYFPDMTDKILLLESLGGAGERITAYMCQLEQMGMLEKINGIILGTFTEMQEKSCSPDVTEIVRGFVGQVLPIVKTEQIGHGTNSKAAVIGSEICLCKNQ